MFKRLLALAVLSTLLLAQNGAVSQISGTVQDSSGSVLPGAQVSLTQTNTGLVRTVTSGADGTYILSNLPVGPYRLQVAKEGFSAFVQSGIVLQVDSNPVINPVLKVGSMVEKIEVTAGAAMVETRNTGVGQVIDNDRVVGLPLDGREPLQLIALSGASVIVGAAGSSNINSLRNFPTLSIQIAGGMIGGTTYTLDGGSYNDTVNNLNLPLPFPDALQEFKVETSAVLARSGQHAGGAVDAVTKSGTNEFHGDAFEFVRNGVFDARPFFAPTRDTLKRNQFGGVIGGPIRRNKLFFFTGYQGTENRTEPVTTNATVLTSDELKGDFTALGSAACGGKPNTFKGPFNNNKVSPAVFNSAALQYAKYIPVSSDACGKYLYGVRSVTSERQIPAKIDYTISPKQSLWGRYTFAANTQPTFYDGSNALLTTQPALYERAQSFVLGETYVISPTTINSFRGSFNRTRSDRNPPAFLSPRDAGINITDLAPHHTDMNVSGYFILGTTWQGYWNTTNSQFADDVDLTRRSHQIAVGVNWIHAILNASNLYYENGTFKFDGTATGNALADFLLGDLDSFTQQAGQLVAVRQNYLGLYFQDTWKVSSHLTLNTGLRWEPYLPPRNIRDWVQVLDLNGLISNQHSRVYPNAPAGVTYPGDPAFPGHSLTDQKLGLFAPRVGLAWDPRGNGRTVVRAAYGMFNDSTHLLSNIGSSNNPPWGSSINLLSPPGGLTNPWLGYPGGNPFPLNLNPGFQFQQYATYNTTFPRHTPPPYMQQWNVTVQRQVGAEWLVSASYLGNKMTHLWLADNINPALYVPGTCVNGPCSTSGNTNQRRLFNTLNPSQGIYFGAVNQTDAGGNGNYNAMLLSIERRFARNFSALANYTWSKCIDDGEFNNDQANAYRVPYNRLADHASCDSDRRQIFNLSAILFSPNTWHGPFGKIARNWLLSPLVQARTGPHITIGNTSNTALFDGAIPVQIADGAVSHPTLQRWFNTSAFINNLAGQQGNVGRNSLDGPGAFTVNAALSRSLTVRERRRIEIRAEAFNLLNRANFSNPNSAIGNVNFGRILSSGDPRILQFALKYLF